MRSNFSKFGAASKHVLAMCARHEHATSHHTPAKIDMILCAGCISKVPKTRVQSKRKRFFKKPGGRAENIGLCCFECWSTFGSTATLGAVNFLMINIKIERSQYRRAPPKEVQAAEDLLIQRQASLRRQKAYPHVELSGPTKKVKVGRPPSVISSPGSST